MRPNDPHRFLIQASRRQQWRHNVKIFNDKYLKRSEIRTWSLLMTYWNICYFGWSHDRWRQGSLWCHTEEVMKSWCSKCAILQNASPPTVLNRIRRSFNIKIRWGLIYWKTCYVCCKIGLKILCSYQDTADLKLGYFNVSQGVLYAFVCIYVCRCCHAEIKWLVMQRTVILSSW